MNKPESTGLRFAAFIRVSTERQAKQGESLTTQRKDVEDSSRRLGGKIVEWYGGQEHATPGWEKDEFNRLLADAASKNRSWNAIIVTDADRWSRDNKESAKGLEILLENGIRFYVGTFEYVLSDLAHKYMLSMAAIQSEFFAQNQSRKSLINRIGRAKNGHPTNGKIPFGRIYEKGDFGKEAVWRIDTKKQNMIKDIARRYLKGESLAELAKTHELNHSNLHKILTKRCGPTWEIRFRSKAASIDELVSINIPPLLPPETIAAIKEKAAANKTYTHGIIKNKYLLSRVVFCEECGQAMFGQTNHNSHRYYRHSHRKTKKPCSAKKAWVRADDLEDAVLRHLFNAFGNPRVIQSAIEAATPDIQKQEDMQSRREGLEKRLAAEIKARKSIMQFMREGKLKHDEGDNQIQESNRKEASIREELQPLMAALMNSPTQEDIKCFAKNLSAKTKRLRVARTAVRLDAKTNNINNDFSRMSWLDKKELIQTVFSGKMPNGKRMGIFISWIDGEEIKRRKRFRFKIIGKLIECSNCVPLGGKIKRDLVDPDYMPAPKQTWLTKSSSY